MATGRWGAGWSSCYFVPSGNLYLNSKAPPMVSNLCHAKPETVQKVVEIVRQQLALPPESEVTPDSKFASLGADSLDTVEIVMGLEEEFDISIEEESSQNISTVQEAANLIEKLVEKKAAA
ncbi:unnamed protein product [Prunus armeniaca]|uniref:Acyl carrier protein n=1 Tax=Prunus armeniaca TaxID=36596 RepID=A0A6J5XA31_PRUAR|nr:unnamed protein product [Prunus armeniaca]